MKQFAVDYYSSRFDSRSKRVDANSWQEAKAAVEALPSVQYATRVWECSWSKPRTVLMAEGK